MSSTKIIAIVLIVAGVLGLAYGKFSYTKETHDAKVGPIEMSVKDKETVNVPVWAGVGAIVIGAGCCSPAASAPEDLTRGAVPPCGAGPLPIAGSRQYDSSPRAARPHPAPNCSSAFPTRSGRGRQHPSQQRSQ